MTQYFYVDESGDAGLEGQASSSSHFVMAMTQLPERARLKPIVDLRKTLRVSPNNEKLVIDGATPAFCRDLRVQFTERCKREERIRPFKNIIGANSKSEDGLQLADMVAGAIRLHAIGS